ncbi:MAG: saccharopine dehydrogenase NADP-binding domain-containing protein [Pseudomonadota bacterium]
MNPAAEHDVVIYGATGFTGRLVVEYMAERYPAGSGVNWAMAGRSEEKLAAIRDEKGAPTETPLIVADASSPESLAAMAQNAKCVLTTVGPYTLYGSPLVEACVAAGADYVDLSGEVLWMRDMIESHGEAAKSSGARIVHSCGFDSIPFDLGVQYLQEEATSRFGAPLPRVRGRMRKMLGTFSGGTAASGAATMAAVKKDPSLFSALTNPFSLAGGFSGPQQPPGDKIVEEDGIWLAPFVMASINTKNIHRSNALMGHPYGEDFVYDEMTLAGPGEKGKATAEAITEMMKSGLGGKDAPKPGEGPSKEEREAGHYDYAAIGTAPDGKTLTAAVTGDKDPGYGSTSKIISEAAICLVQECANVDGGVYTPAAAMGAKLRTRLVANAGLTFDIED